MVHVNVDLERYGLNLFHMTLERIIVPFQRHSKLPFPTCSRRGGGCDGSARSGSGDGCCSGSYCMQCKHLRSVISGN